MTAKKTAKKTTAAPKNRTGKQIKTARSKIALTAQERAEEAAEAAGKRLAELAETVTQREWLLVSNKLDRSREQINADGSLRLLALAWIREKRDHGGASWDRLLDLTDAELLELHGIQVEADAGDDDDDDGSDGGADADVDDPPAPQD